MRTKRLVIATVAMLALTVGVAVADPFTPDDGGCLGNDTGYRQAAPGSTTGPVGGTNGSVKYTAEQGHGILTWAPMRGIVRWLASLSSKRDSSTSGA